MNQIGNLVNETIKEIQEVSCSTTLKGIPSGFTKLDELTSGWQSSNLIVIAARPGMGKTAFITSMARNIAVDFDIPVGFFSIEMSSTQLITRMISSETGISSSKLRKGNLQAHEWEQLNVKTKNISNAPIFINDNANLSIDDLVDKAKEFINNNDVEIIFIDYIQLLNINKPKRQNREEELSIIIKKLKILSREFNIPVIVTSQLSRAVETRGGIKRPWLSDIRDSGAIEDDADMVCFLFRPEYYGQTEWDDDSHSPCEGQGELIVAKHRNGRLENIRLKFIEHLAQFLDLEEGFDIDFQSKMNAIPDSAQQINPDDAFGDDTNDVPF